MNFSHLPRGLIRPMPNWPRLCSFLTDLATDLSASLKASLLTPFPSSLMRMLRCCQFTRTSIRLACASIAFCTASSITSLRVAYSPAIRVIASPLWKSNSIECML